MSEVTIDLIDRLVEKVPALGPLLHEHLADNFGEVLPHVFFGEVTRYAVGAFARAADDGATPKSESLRLLLHELEEAFVNGGDEVSELVAVSFLQNLPRRGEEGDGVRDLLGSSLKSELERIG